MSRAHVRIRCDGLVPSDAQMTMHQLGLGPELRPTAFEYDLALDEDDDAVDDLGHGGHGLVDDHRGSITGRNRCTAEIFGPVPKTALSKCNPRVERCTYSITSSARAKIVAGIVSPKAFAVWALTTSRNLVGCWTGISAGEAPLSSWSTCVAEM